MQYKVNVLNEVKRYPPVPPASTYKRTGNLSRSWHTEDFGNATSGMGVRIVSNARNKYGTPYSVFVQGRPGYQRQLFADYGWRTAWDINLEYAAEFKDRVSDILKQNMKVAVTNIG
jgi:hypothetical protein